MIISDDELPILQRASDAFIPPSAQLLTVLGRDGQHVGLVGSPRAHYVPPGLEGYRGGHIRPCKGLYPGGCSSKSRWIKGVNPR